MKEKKYTEPLPYLSTGSHESEEVKTGPAVEAEPVVKDKTTVGVVVNCDYLRLRSEPNTDEANIIRSLEAGTALVIDLNESTEGFYKVYTENGTEGYCMKPFVAIN